MSSFQKTPLDRPYNGSDKLRIVNLWGKILRASADSEVKKS